MLIKINHRLFVFLINITHTLGILFYEILLKKKCNTEIKVKDLIFIIFYDIFYDVKVFLCVILLYFIYLSIFNAIKQLNNYNTWITYTCYVKYISALKYVKYCTYDQPRVKILCKLKI